MHATNGRYTLVIEEQANILTNVDPVAKSCLPAFEEMFYDSNEYGPSLKDNQRVMYNMIYRLGKVYNTTYHLDRAIKEFSSDFGDGSDPSADDKTLTEYVSESKVIGELTGIQFKNLLSVEK